MTTLPSFIEVLFEVPSEIAKGLASREMVRRGGVIQWASGDAKGEVVAWLKEVGGLAQGTSSVPAPVVGQLQSLQLATGALAVGQALTLGFSVLSFAILNHKLNVLGQKLDSVLAEIAELKQEVAWLDRRQDIALEARLRGALDQAKWAYSGGRLEALVGVRAVLVEVEQHYTGLLLGMLETQRAHQHAELFATYEAYLSIAGTARTRCEVVLDGAEAGVSAVQGVRAALGQIDEAFRAPLRNVAAHLHLLRLGVGAERTLRPALEAMTEMAHRVEGYQSELEYCTRKGIPLSNWEQLGEVENGGRLALLVPRPDRETG